MSDLPEFYNESRPMARKAHRCCECNAWIAKGARHRVISGKWDGQMATYRQHDGCADIYDAMAKFRRDIIGSFWDEIPGLTELSDAAWDDENEGDARPSYWPDGMPVSRKALAAYSTMRDRIAFWRRRKARP